MDWDKSEIKSTVYGSCQQKQILINIITNALAINFETSHRNIKKTALFLSLIII